MEQLPVNLTLEGNSTFLENIECVPYYKLNATGYYPALLPQEQEIGWILPLECEIAEFPVPRLLNSSSYECCKIGTLPQQRYYTNDDFYATVSIELVAYSLAAIASALIAVGLLAPLLSDLLNQRQGGTSKRKSLKRSKSRRILAPAKPRYSTYNLYLVYLAIPDLMYALLRIWIDCCMLTQRSIPKGWENGRYFGSSSSWPSIFRLAYLMANLVMNAVISYEVLVLLRSSRAVQRIKQPSLKRANLQGLAVYVLSLIYAVGMWTALERSICLGHALLFPTLYVLGVNFVIWWRGYLPPSSGRNNSSPTTPSERAMRTLALYFFCIAYVFIGVWVPALAFERYGNYTKNRWANFLYLLIPAIQAIVSTGMILTKPDVRKHVWNLLTLYKACFPKNQSDRASLSIPKKLPPNSEETEETNDRNNDGSNNNDQHVRNVNPEDTIQDHPPDVENGRRKTLPKMNDSLVSNHTNTSSSTEIIVFPSTNSEVGSHSITHPTISEVDG